MVESDFRVYQQSYCGLLLNFRDVTETVTEMLAVDWAYASCCPSKGDENFMGRKNVVPGPRVQHAIMVKLVQPIIRVSGL